MIHYVCWLLLARLILDNEKNVNDSLGYNARKSRKYSKLGTFMISVYDKLYWQIINFAVNTENINWKINK